jgi:hypothetical protein
MAHTRRRTFSSLDDAHRVKALVAEFTNEDFDRWKTDLSIAWRKNKRAEQPAFDPETVKERNRGLPGSVCAIALSDS